MKMIRRYSYFAIFIFLLSCVTPRKEIYIIERISDKIIAELPQQVRNSSYEIWELIEKGKGKKAYLKLKRMDPNSFFTSLSMGYSLLLMDNLEQSELWFRKALSINKEVSSPHIGLAQVLEKKGDLKGAFSEWREAYSLNPQNVNVKLRLERLKNVNTERAIKEANSYISSNDIENGIKSLEEVLFYSPELVSVRLQLVELLEKRGRELECISHLEIISRDQPENLSIKRKLGVLYLKYEKYERAYEIFRELASIDPKDKEIKELLLKAENGILALKVPTPWREIPNKKAITRADLAGLVAVKFQKYFKDLYIKPPIIVDISNHWAQNFILQVTSLEIMDVYPNHAFYPEDFISRQNFAVAIYRLIDVLERLGKNIYSKLEYRKPEIKDVPLEHTLRATIEKLVGYGIMSVKENGFFKPGDPVSGSESLSIISFIYELAETGSRR